MPLVFLTSMHSNLSLVYTTSKSDTDNNNNNNSFQTFYTSNFKLYCDISVMRFVIDEQYLSGRKGHDDEIDEAIRDIRDSAVKSMFHLITLDLETIRYFDNSISITVSSTKQNCTCILTRYTLYKIKTTERDCMNGI